jgi:transposase InsO family protein
MRVIRTPIRAPNANAYAERVIETMRAECLDWTLIQGRRHLDRTLQTYAEHYNRRRPHRALALAHRWPKRGTRSPSVRATFAGWICSAGSSTSTIAPPRDRIRVSDPHGFG